MRTSSGITAEELAAHIDSLKLKDSTRPPGYATRKEMAIALFESDKVLSIEAGLTKVARMLDLLDYEERLAKVKVRSTGPSGQPRMTDAFKILPAAKPVKGKSR